jgi:hypothetical protein
MEQHKGLPLFVEQACALMKSFIVIFTHVIRPDCDPVASGLGFKTQD